MWASVGGVSVGGPGAWATEVVAAGGGVVVVSTGGRQVELLDAATLACVWTAAPHSGGALDAGAWGEWGVCSGGREGGVALMDVRARGRQGMVMGMAGTGPAMGVAARGEEVLAASGEALWVLETRTMRPRARMEEGHAGELATVRWGEGGAVTAGVEDGLVGLWRAEGGGGGWGEDALQETWNEEAPVCRLDWLSGDEVLASSLQQSSLWRRGERVWTLEKGEAYAPCGAALGRVAMAHRDGAVAMVPAPVAGAPQGQVWLMGGHRAPVRAVMQMGETVYSAGEDGGVVAWRAQAGMEPKYGQAAGPVRQVGNYGFVGMHNNDNNQRF